MTATSPSSKASRRSQAEKNNSCGHCMKQQRQVPDAELVMKGKPLHALKFFFT